MSCTTSPVGTRRPARLGSREARPAPRSAAWRTLYQQFGSKDQLVAQSLDAHGAAILRSYMPADAQHLDLA
jgi:hypothetical protein